MSIESYNRVLMDSWVESFNIVNAHVVCAIGINPDTGFCRISTTVPDPEKLMDLLAKIIDDLKKGGGPTSAQVATGWEL